MVNISINTDKQAEKAARRKDRLDRRKARLEEHRDSRVERHEARIAKIKSDAAVRIRQIDEDRKPLAAALIHFVTVVRQRKQTLMLSTGTELAVYLNYKVVAERGDDDAAVAELEAKGHGDCVIVSKKPNRQLLKQKARRHIVEEMDSLSLQPVRALKIRLAKR